ncbi:MAG TPA: PAS domain S-box protein [Candidatus Solibacter sp.]|jgi:PAS domain S-box-containing protein|nr:PAS domain S-box protein [Candidatus Solibacter sp.]
MATDVAPDIQPDELRALLASIVHYADDAIISKTLDGTITSWNPAAETLYGYPAVEVVGENISVVTPDDRLAEEAALLRRVARGQRIQHYETKRRRKDGSEIDVSVTLSPIIAISGRVLGASSIARDVTERKKIEAKFQGLVESAPDAVVAVDTEGIIRIVNRQAEAVFGYRREELIGQKIEILVPDQVRSGHPKHRGKYFRDPKTRPMGAGLELAARRKDGTEFPCDISLSALETEDGMLVSAAVRDVTERKKIEAKFQGLLESAPDAVVAVDAGGIIRIVNRQAETLFGYQREELMGHPIEVLVPDRVREIHPGHRTNYFADPKTRPMGASLELSARRKDGSEFPCDISLSSLETEEGILVSAAVRDVTEREQAQREKATAEAEREKAILEAQLHQSQRLESLGQLAGGVAHDFNNLLAVIVNYAGFVAEEVGDNESLKSDVEEIRKAAERAAALTHQLLIFGRREVIQPRVLDLNSVIADMEKLLRRTLGEHIDLRIRLAPDLASIKADPSQLDQVLVNLAINARDAMSGGGALMINTANSDLDEEYARMHPDVAPGRYVCLTVSDTGSGMSAEVKARALEPFFTTKARGEGSGLGLATVYGIVTQAEGQIELYSEHGHGTTFKLYFPATAGKASPVHARGVADVKPLVGGTILLAEDEDAVREMTRRILSRAGYRLLTASNAEQAMRAAADEEGPIHLLLTDVIMPKASGKELATQIAKERPKTRVLYMSGYPQDVIVHQGVLESDVDLIEKPFSAEALLEKVESVLGGTPNPLDGLPAG